MTERISGSEIGLGLFLTHLGIHQDPAAILTNDDLPAASDVQLALGGILLKQPPQTSQACEFAVRYLHLENMS